MNYSSVQHPNPINLSNVKVVCRIRPPQNSDRKRLNQTKANKSMNQTINLQSVNKSYTSVRNRTRSNSRESTQSPFKHGAKIRQTSKEPSSMIYQTSNSISSSQRSNSKQNSMSQHLRRDSGSFNKSKGKIAFNSGLLDSDTRYCLFSTKERSQIVVASETPIPGKVINQSLIEPQDLNFFKESVLGDQAEVFHFDQVLNENYKQDKFYQAVVSPAINGFVEGANTSILMFGPTDGGKTFTLKGKTGAERGILPRAVEDIFNIVKNSESMLEDEYETINLKMMSYSSDNEEYQSSQDKASFIPAPQYGEPTYPSNKQQDRNEYSERMFLKISVYQIFMDKVLDLLGSQKSPSTHRAQIDNFIDRESQEVVSKLVNITEKAVFSLEDFYCVLQEAFKNRRIESVNNTLNESDLRKKAHFVIGLTLMRRTQDKKIQEISKCNFVELCGSEQAVAEDAYFKSQSVRQFVTKSFNGLSSLIMKSALKKRSNEGKSSNVSSLEEGDVKLVNCIRQTLTANSNIVLVCNVNPSQSAYEHSLPAIKFCSRIRESIIKKLRANVRQSRDQAFQTQGASSESMRSDHQSYRGGVSKENYNSININTHTHNSSRVSQDMPTENYLQSQIQKLKEEVNFRQSNLYQFDGKQNQAWSFNIQERIDELIKEVYDGQHEKNKLSSTLLIQQLDFLRSTVSKMRHRDRSISDERVRRSASGGRAEGSSNQYMPVRSNGPNYESSYASSRERQPGNARQIPSDQDLKQSYSSQQRGGLGPFSAHNNQFSNMKSETSDYIYTVDEFQKTSNTLARTNPFSQISSFSNQKQDLNPIRSSLSPSQYRSVRPAPQNQGYQSKQAPNQQIVEEHDTIILSDKGGKLNTQGNNSQASNSSLGATNPQIKVYQRSQQDLNSIIPSKSHLTQGSQQLTNLNNTVSINNIDAYELQSVVHSENDFLNKINPLQENLLQPRENSIMNSYHSQRSTPDLHNNNINQTGLSKGYRTNQTNQSLLQQKQSQLPNQSIVQVQTLSDDTFLTQAQQRGLNQPLTGTSLNTFNISKSIKNPLTTYLQTQNATMRQSLNQSALSQPISDNISRISAMRQETVYQHSQEALSDLSRLLKLGDFEGLKLRFIQVLKEKEESQKILDEQVELLKLMRVEIVQKDELLEDQDRLIRDAHHQFQNTIEEVNQLKLEREVEHGQQTQELAQHMKELQQRIQETEAEKDRLAKSMEILEVENRELIKLRQEADENFGRVKEENDKLRGNYDILKEHELNIIKDYEAKKHREIQFYEQKMVEASKQAQEDKDVRRDLEEKLFEAREELQRINYELLKTQDDRQHQQETQEQINTEISQLRAQQEKGREQMSSLKREIESLTARLEQAEADKNQAINEISKLHMLIEEMDKTIQQEQAKTAEEALLRKQKEQQIETLNEEKQQLQEQVLQRDQQIEVHQAQEEEYKRQMSQLAQMHDELEMQLTKMKAREYDKVDVMKKGVEVESKLTYYRLDNENLVRERNNLDIANVTLKRQNQELQSQLSQATEELEFFKQAHEQHLDRFDSKFEQITVELSKLKNENIQLKEREKATKKLIRELEEERDEFDRQARNSDRRAEELQQQVQEIEREVRVIMQEKEREAKDALVSKLQFEQRAKEDEKAKMVGDIQGMIKSFKQERHNSRITTNQQQNIVAANQSHAGIFDSTNKENIIVSPKNGHRTTAGGGYSTNSSIYY